MIKKRKRRKHATYGCYRWTKQSIARTNHLIRMGLTPADAISTYRTLLTEEIDEVLGRRTPCVEELGIGKLCRLSA